MKTSETQRQLWMASVQILLAVTYDKVQRRDPSALESIPLLRDSPFRNRPESGRLFQWRLGCRPNEPEVI